MFSLHHFSLNLVTIGCFREIPLVFDLSFLEFKRCSCMMVSWKIFVRVPMIIQMGQGILVNLIMTSKDL
ncbi:hypothetical protein FGO68_gene1847 [Halteria grandinella]|uniref:Uncharacterized protein n=1 Tax=Halteria grandinella TaxID=5974 RepID=A0A8J8T4W1_HALGN|nr:hypothetical protein FGO68_gene1847 [Halteria grandinella]